MKTIAEIFYLLCMLNAGVNIIIGDKLSAILSLVICLHIETKFK